MESQRAVRAHRTHLERADAVRAKFQTMYSELNQLSKDLVILLDEARVLPQNGGDSDGTISEVQFNQLQTIQKNTDNLLRSLLFDTRKP